jgi:predicted small lipoprotein YifL
MKRNHTFAVRTGRALHTASCTAALAMMAAMAGCGSSAPLFAPDGSPTTLVQCPNGSDSCEQQALASCGGGYEVVRQSVDAGVRNLLYSCKPH